MVANSDRGLAEDLGKRPRSYGRPATAKGSSENRVATPRS